MKKIISLIQLVSLLILLSSCSTQRTSLKSGEKINLMPDRGYLLIGVKANRDLKYLYIKGEENIELGSKDIRRGTNYILLDLAAGDYHVTGISVPSYWTSSFFHDFDDEENWAFKIIPNKINYIGHLEIQASGTFFKKYSYSNSAYAELANKSSEALEFIESDFDYLLKKYPMIYAGPGDDFFLEFVLGKKQ